MPFGKKQDVAGSIIDFDSVYGNFISPTIKQAGLEPIRADEEMTGGIIIRQAREKRQESVNWADEIEKVLRHKALQVNKG